MLDAIGRHSKGFIGKIIMTIAMSLLILSFGIWGVGDILRGRVDTSVAHVGGVAISVDEYQTALQRQVEAMRESLGPDFDMTKARDLGIDRRVLDSIIRTTALDLGARDLGLTFPDDTLAKQIRDMPAFRGPFGGFDRDRFRAVLRQSGYSEERFLAALRGDGVRGQLLETVTGGISPPALMLNPLYSYLAEQRIARYLILPPDAAGQVPTPSTEELRVYYEDNKENYRAPEYRAFTYIVMTPEAIAPSIQVSEEDLRKQYEAHREQYGEPEKRTVLQLVFDTEEEARAARAEIDGGKSFAEIAKAQGHTVEDIRLDNKTRADLAIPMGDKAADAAFNLADGAVSVPIEGRFGWLLLKVENVAPGYSLSFADARDQIHNDLAKDEAGGRVIDLANAVEDARASGASLEEAAKAAGVETITVSAIDAEGKDPEGKPIPSLADKPDILREVFSQDVNMDADMKPIGDGGYFVVRVNRITPADIRPLESIKKKVTDDYIRAERAHRLEALASRLAARVRRGASLAALAAEIGRAPLTSDPIQRGTANETFSRAAVDKLFSAKVGEAVWGPVGLGESMLLMQLTEVRKPNPQSDPAGYSSLRDEVTNALASDAELELSDALQEQFEVRVNDSMLEQMSSEQ